MADKVGVVGMLWAIVALVFFVSGLWIHAGVCFVIAIPLVVYACWKGKPMINDGHY